MLCCKRGRGDGYAGDLAKGDNKVKLCGRCKRALPNSAFAANKAKKDGLQERCRECRKLHHAAVGKYTRSKPTPETKRKHMLSCKYKLTPEGFSELLVKQNNRCAICGTTEWGRPSPSVDHCHNTGRVRGLLCNTCNRALGLFKDSEELLLLAANYIKENNEYK